MDVQRTACSAIGTMETEPEDPKARTPEGGARVAERLMSVLGSVVLTPTTNIAVAATATFPSSLASARLSAGATTRLRVPPRRTASAPAIRVHTHTHTHTRLDDDSVVYTVGICVSILNVTTGEQNLHEVSATAGQAVRAFAVTTGKQRVLATVSAYQEPVLCITKLATGATIVEVPAPGGDLAETTALAFSADGKRLAALCVAPVCKCHILDAATGATLCSADLTEGVAAGAHGVLAFHPTRSDLVAVAGARTCRIVRFPQGLETHPAWYVDVDTLENAHVGADTSSVWWDGDALLLGNSVGSMNIIPFAAGAPRPGGGVAEAQLVAESFVGDEAADAMDTAAPNKCVFVAAMEGDVVASVHTTVVRSREALDTG
ncbi:citrate synthase [Pseudoscourfieldia marina]